MTHREKLLALSPALLKAAITLIQEPHRSPLGGLRVRARHNALYLVQGRAAGPLSDLGNLKNLAQEVALMRTEGLLPDFEGPQAPAGRPPAAQTSTPTAASSACPPSECASTAKPTPAGTDLSAALVCSVCSVPAPAVAALNTHLPAAEPQTPVMTAAHPQEAGTPGLEFGAPAMCPQNPAPTERVTSTIVVADATSDLTEVMPSAGKHGHTMSDTNHAELAVKTQAVFPAATTSANSNVSMIPGKRPWVGHSAGEPRRPGLTTVLTQLATWRGGIDVSTLHGAGVLSLAMMAGLWCMVQFVDHPSSGHTAPGSPTPLNDVTPSPNANSSVPGDGLPAHRVAASNNPTSATTLVAPSIATAPSKKNDVNRAHLVRLRDALLRCNPELVNRDAGRIWMVAVGCIEHFASASRMRYDTLPLTWNVCWTESFEVPTINAPFTWDQPDTPIVPADEFAKVTGVYWDDRHGGTLYLKSDSPYRLWLAVCLLNSGGIHPPTTTLHEPEWTMAFMPPYVRFQPRRDSEAR